MKLTIFILLLILSTAAMSQVKHVTYYLSITDSAQINNIDTGTDMAGDVVYTISFNDTNITKILSKYIVYHFEQAMPMSWHLFLRQLYVVSSDSENLAVELVKYNSVLFPFYELIPDAMPAHSSIIAEGKNNGYYFTTFPNPVNSKLTIQCNKPNTASINIKIIDLTGKQLITEPNISLGLKGNCSVSTEILHPGVYSIIINDNDGNLQRIKFIKSN